MIAVSESSKHAPAAVAGVASFEQYAEEFTITGVVVTQVRYFDHRM